MADPTDPPDPPDPPDRLDASGDTGPVDEVGFDLGADDVVPGLLDAWAGRTRPGEEGSGTGELTSSFRPDELPLTAVLARVAAGLGREAALDRFSASEGRPSGAVKALIADEPLDPLPPPEGLPLSGAGFLDVEAVADDTAVAEMPGRSRLDLVLAEAPTAHGESGVDEATASGALPQQATAARIRLLGITAAVVLVLVAFAWAVLHSA